MSDELLIYTFTCEFKKCDVFKFGSRDYIKFPIYDKKGKKVIGTTYSAKCPICESTSSFNEYFGKINRR